MIIKPLDSAKMCSCICTCVLVRINSKKADGLVSLQMKAGHIIRYD